MRSIKEINNIGTIQCPITNASGYLCSSDCIYFIETDSINNTGNCIYIESLFIKMCNNIIKINEEDPEVQDPELDPLKNVLNNTRLKEKLPLLK